MVKSKIDTNYFLIFWEFTTRVIEEIGTKLYPMQQMQSRTINDNNFYKQFARNFRILNHETIEPRSYYYNSQDFRQELINIIRKTYKIVTKKIEKSKIKQEVKKY